MARLGLAGRKPRLSGLVGRKPRYRPRVTVATTYLNLGSAIGRHTLGAGEAGLGPWEWTPNSVVKGSGNTAGGAKKAAA
jgi:hypothetical protein